MVKNQVILTLAPVILIASLLRFPHVIQGFFAFTFDQGRDLLAVTRIVYEHNITLIGPTTGLPGIFYGPWWYYFLSPLVLISNADPEIITLIFALIGLLTVILIYFLTYKITKSYLVSSAISVSAALSQSFLTSSSQIWSPSLVLPLMILYITSLYKIMLKNSINWLLVLGITCGLIMDSGAAFGIMLTVATVITSLFFRKEFIINSYKYLLIGFLIILLPRIIFDLRHDFLISKSIVAWFTSPQVYQEKLTIGERFLNRLDLFLLNFSQTFSQSNKLLTVFPLLIMFFATLKASRTLFKNKLSFSASKLSFSASKLYQFLVLTTLFIYLGSVIYPDAVWDYYLVGLPPIFLIVLAISMAVMEKQSKIIAKTLILLVILVNFNINLLSSFSLNWQGDGAIYRNQLIVVESLKDKLQGDYSLHVYTPARFDYPFDYLIWWYSKRELVNLPKDNQDRIYLIIRDDSEHTYLSSGWYGDKLKNEPQLVDRVEFTGNIIVEEYQRSEKI